MEQKRGGLVLIGKVAVRLPGIEGRGRAMSARARHHFTTLRQVTQLIEASEAEPDLGFMARLLALCSLPRTNPRDRLQYERSNGPYKLCMIAGSGKKLPFGNVPRLLLAWVCSEAVRTQSRELVLGRSLYEFMRKLGMADRSGSASWSSAAPSMSSCESSAWPIAVGARAGDRARLKNQMRRLFTCSVQLVYAEGEHEVVVSSFIAERADFWWSVRKPDAPVLWDSTIELGEKFFQEIIAHPVPLDMHILKALKRSPLGLDLYFWLVYRTFVIKTPLTLTWRQLYRQFGAEAAQAGNRNTVNRFRSACLRELKKIKRAWPGLNYHTVTGGLVIEPSPPRIPPVKLRLINE